MNKESQINSIERKLHAAKGHLKELRQARWVNENYQEGKPVGKRTIKQTESEILQYRKQLKQLY